jgi:hypothetical protein
MELFQTLVPKAFQPLFFPGLFLQLPIRAFSKEDAVVAHWFTTNPLYFTKTTSAEEVKADAIGIGLNQLVQARSQFCVLSVV